MTSTPTLWLTRHAMLFAHGSHLLACKLMCSLPFGHAGSSSRKHRQWKTTAIADPIITPAPVVKRSTDIPSSASECAEAFGLEISYCSRYGPGTEGCRHLRYCSCSIFRFCPWLMILDTSNIHHGIEKLWNYLRPHRIDNISPACATGCFI